MDPTPMHPTPADEQRRRDCEYLVAAAVVDRLAETGNTVPLVHDLLNDDVLRGRDFALLGLSSLDWMALATRLETECGVELTDEALIDADQRCVAGWSACLFAAGATIGPPR